MGHYWDELHEQLFTIAFLGGVIGNLTASLLWAIPAFGHLHRKLNKHHQWHVDQVKEND